MPSITISYKDKLTNEEDDSVQPMVAEDESDDEEGDTEEDGHARDEVDEVVDLLGDRGLSSVQARSEAGDTAHHLLNRNNIELATWAGFALGL